MIRSASCRVRRPAGFTLIDLVVALTILSIGLGTTLTTIERTIIPNATKTPNTIKSILFLLSASAFRDLNSVPVAPHDSHASPLWYGLSVCARAPLFPGGKN